MGKFSAAKMTGAQDAKFQNAFNQLIDLLDSGYVAESMMGGHKVRVSVDPKGGMQILSDGVQIGGVVLVNGVPLTVSGGLTNDATNPAFVANIGEVVEGATSYKGIFGYLMSLSTTSPIWRLISYVSAVHLRIKRGVQFNISDVIDGKDLWSITGIGGQTGTSLNRGTVNISAGNENGIRLASCNVNSTTSATDAGLNAYAQDGSNRQSIGADNNGPYYIKNGAAKTYF